MTHTTITHYTPDTLTRWETEPLRRTEFKRWICDQTTPASTRRRARVVLEIGGYVHPDWTPAELAVRISQWPTDGPAIRHLVAVMGDLFDASDAGHRAFHRAFDPVDGPAPLCCRCWL